MDREAALEAALAVAWAAASAAALVLMERWAEAREDSVSRAMGKAVRITWEARVRI